MGPNKDIQDILHGTTGSNHTRVKTIGYQMINMNLRYLGQVVQSIILSRKGGLILKGHLHNDCLLLPLNYCFRAYLYILKA